MYTVYDSLELKVSKFLKNLFFIRRTFRKRFKKAKSINIKNDGQHTLNNLKWSIKIIPFFTNHDIQNAYLEYWTNPDKSYPLDKVQIPLWTTLISRFIKIYQNL